MDIFNKSAELFRDAASSVVTEILTSRQTEDYLGIEAVKRAAIEVGVVPLSEKLPVSDEVRDEEINRLEVAVNEPVVDEAKQAPTRSVEPVKIVKSDDEITEMQRFQDEARRLIEAAHQKADV